MIMLAVNAGVPLASFIMVVALILRHMIFAANILSLQITWACAISHRKTLQPPTRQ
jgi:hypothetical protein